MKKIFNNTLEIFINSLPVIAMIAFIPMIKDDFLLAIAYLIIIAIAFAIKYEKNEIVFFSFGFFVMIVSEYFFISTGVETFVRRSLLNVMPIWLPLLWAYGFVAIKRTIKILEK